MLTLNTQTHCADLNHNCRISIQWMSTAKLLHAVFHDNLVNVPPLSNVHLLLLLAEGLRSSSTIGESWTEFSRGLSEQSSVLYKPGAGSGISRGYPRTQVQ